MDPSRNGRKKKLRHPQRKERKRMHYYNDDEDNEYSDDAYEDDDEEKYEAEMENYYERKMRDGRDRRGLVGHYMRKETSFCYAMTIGVCKKSIRLGCGGITYIASFLGVCFFLGTVMNIIYKFYSFFS